MPHIEKQHGLKAAGKAGGQHKTKPLWPIIRAEAAEAAAQDPVMGPFLRYFVLERRSLIEALALRLVARLHHKVLDEDMLAHSFISIFALLPRAEAMLEADLRAVYERDAATSRFMEPLLYYKGFHALQTHRIAHALWQAQRRDFALYLQSRSSSVFQTDIHPAARIGEAVFLDHATGVVIGETAVIENNVSLLHSVTLGGTGKIGGDRHPKIRHGVLIGAGAKILGNIEVGACAKVAANSIVLKNVPPFATVAGVPARIVSQAGVSAGKSAPSSSMDQTFVYGDGEGI